MKLILRQTKPRNPLVAAAHGRRAGAHRRSAGGQRQQFKQSLRRDLAHEPLPSP
jgi:hypothetical protein